jgi:putative SOS response-associated peptidase YedK
MCNRVERGDTIKTDNLFKARVLTFNEGPLTVHPKEAGIVVRRADGELVVESMTWGFPVPFKSKKTGLPLKPKPVNNARFDKLGTFWRRWATSPDNRCLIPSARYAEAVGEPGRMTETWLSVRDQPIFAWAALWSDSPEWGKVYTGVMTENAPELIDIHDRSPVIIDPEHWETWLNAPLAELYQFDQPYPSERLVVDATASLWAKKPGPSPDQDILI